MEDTNTEAIRRKKGNSSEAKSVKEATDVKAYIVNRTTSQTKRKSKRHHFHLKTLISVWFVQRP